MIFELLFHYLQKQFHQRLMSPRSALYFFPYKLTYIAGKTTSVRKVEIKGPCVTARTAGEGLRTIFYQNVKNKNGIYIVKDIFKSFYDNPDKYHKPKFTAKPKDWSNKQWKEYKQQHNL